MREKRMVMYKKGVFMCTTCQIRFIHENFIESWRIRCPKCGSTPEDLATEDQVNEETIKY